MKKYIIPIFIFVILHPSVIFAAGESATEQMLRTVAPPPSRMEAAPEGKGEISLDSYYEGSRVVQGSRPGRWKEITNRIAYKYKNVQAYATMSQWQRFSVNNYTANFGAYLTFPNSYAHLEAG
ncbi:MAG: hypothetical protein PHY56_04520, partial [Candidatus Omnitrophica bacterium]|nr:hypothetical protein [Candidatus Omnitrophota bacterium]